MENKNISTDDLARMLQKEFSQIHQKLNKLEENDQVIIKHLSGIVYREEFEKLEGRIIELENLLAVSVKRK